MAILETGGAAGGGSILGVIFAWFGFKGKIQDIEKRVDRISDNVVFQDTCDAKHEALVSLMQETREDVKELLKK